MDGDTHRYVPSISISISIIITSRRLRTIYCRRRCRRHKKSSRSQKVPNHVSSEDTSMFPKKKEETENLAAAPALRPVLIIYRLRVLK
jgi:hypothetical protein